MWVADMDFPAPPDVVEAMIKRAAHGIYGYSRQSAGYWDSLINWYQKRNHVTFEEEWLVQSPGVLYSLRAFVELWTIPGDGILVQTPAYPPFKSIPEQMERNLVLCPLCEKEGYWTMNFQLMEDHFAQGVKLFILCNPHNPTGRVWTKDELETLAVLCAKYNVKVISDEIHCDIIMPGNVFDSFIKYQRERLDICTLVSCTKTFNLAGLRNSTAIITDENLRERFKKTMFRFAPQGADLFAVVARNVAYEKGESWLDNLIHYLDVNYDLSIDILRNQTIILPRKSEGTYLMLTDCRALGMSDEELENFFVEKCGVFPSMGIGFSAPGYVRFNLAAPRQTIEIAFTNIVDALGKLTRGAIRKPK
jgi:cystathionine beta-lyase